VHAELCVFFLGLLKEIKCKTELRATVWDGSTSEDVKLSSLQRLGVLGRFK